MTSLLLALAAACSLPAGDERIPSHVAGVWGTDDPLFARTPVQGELHLKEDGFGVLVGASPPSVRASGPDEGKPAPRIAKGIPFRARLEGRTLTLQPFNPDSPHDTGPPLQCRYVESGPRLECGLGERGMQVMQRRSTLLDPRVVQGLEEMRTKLLAYGGKASALRPEPSPRP